MIGQGVPYARLKWRDNRYEQNLDQVHSFRHVPMNFLILMDLDFHHGLLNWKRKNASLSAVQMCSKS